MSDCQLHKVVLDLSFTVITARKNTNESCVVDSIIFDCYHGPTPNHKSQITGCIFCGGFYGGVGSGLCLGHRPGTPSGLPGPEPDQLWGAVAHTSDGLGTFAGLCKLAAIRHGLSGYEPRFADRAAAVSGDGWSPLSGRFENIPQRRG